jgi:hypothetical protein
MSGAPHSNVMPARRRVAPSLSLHVACQRRRDAWARDRRPEWPHSAKGGQVITILVINLVTDWRKEAGSSVFTWNCATLPTHEFMALPSSQAPQSDHLPVPASSAPAEQLAKRKHEQIEPEHPRPSANLSRAHYNRSVGSMIREEQVADEAAARYIQDAKMESEKYFDMLLQNADRD